MIENVKQARAAGLSWVELTIRNADRSSERLEGAFTEAQAHSVLKFAAELPEAVPDAGGKLTTAVPSTVPIVESTPIVSFEKMTATPVSSVAQREQASMEASIASSRPSPRRKHSRSGQLKCELCAPAVCKLAAKGSP